MVRKTTHEFVLKVIEFGKLNLSLFFGWASVGKAYLSAPRMKKYGVTTSTFCSMPLVNITLERKHVHLSRDSLKDHFHTVAFVFVNASWKHVEI